MSPPQDPYPLRRFAWLLGGSAGSALGCRLLLFLLTDLDRDILQQLGQHVLGSIDRCPDLPAPLPVEMKLTSSPLTTTIPATFMRAPPPAPEPCLKRWKRRSRRRAEAESDVDDGDEGDVSDGDGLTNHRLGLKGFRDALDDALHI